MIDTSMWKEFMVGDYFHGVRGTSRKMQGLNDGKTPVIAAARYNQGIAGFYDVPSEYENAITISCNGVGCGSTYYHDYPFAITGDAIVLENLGEVPRGALHYIAAVYDACFSRKYSYTDKCSADKIEAEIIKLPATSDGQPDWAYMESYMKQIMEESEKSLENLKKADNTKHLIDTSMWKEFKVSDFFEVLKGRNKLSNTDIDEGDTPVYSSNSSNGGVFGYTSKEPDYVIDEDTPFYITFGDHTKAINIAEQSFCVMDNVKVLTSKIRIHNVLRFIMTSWMCNVPNLGYSRHWSAAKKVIFKLPIDSQGEPDWQYMEDYMRNIEAKTIQTLDSFAS